MEKLKNIPSLRFPEFDGEWNLQKIGEITDKVNSGKTPLGGESVYVEKGVLFIRSQNVLDSKLSFENSTFITEAINNTMKNSVVKSNDILLNITGASLGRSCVVPNDFTIGDDLTVFVYLDHEERPVATTLKPFISLNCLLTSSTIPPAAFPTACIANELNKNGSIPPINKPIITFGSEMLITFIFVI